MLKKILGYISSNRLELSCLLVILVVGAFFRLYKISDYMTFLGDEGRDVMVAKGILQGDLTLLGPRASAGDFFLGPIYYYMIAPFLLLTKLDPVGPAIMVALFGIVTVGLVYYVGKTFFGRKAGMIASSLYAISPLVVAYSRSSWNPNLMPFFSLLLLFLIIKAVKSQSIRLFVLVGFLLGIAIQLHYLTVFLGVIVFFFVVIGEVMHKKKALIMRYLSHGASLFIGFLVGLAPFLLFEIRHGFPNIVTIFKFIFEDNTTKLYSPGQSFLGNIWDVSFRLFGRLITKFPPPEQINLTEHLDLRIWQIATVVLAIFSIAALYRAKDKLKVLLLSLWLFFGVLLFGIYKKPIYDYYLGFMFPLPFLLVGNFLSQTSSIKRYKKLGIIIGSIVFGVILVFNLTGAPFRFPGNKQKDQAKNIAMAVLSKTNGMPYNFALLTRGNSDHVYRYFLEVENRAPVTILNHGVDPLRKSVTDQLMVVCEYQDCQPLGNSLWEIAGFGKAEITGVWEVPFVKIYRLVHYHRPEDFTLKNQELTALFDNSSLGFSFKYPDSFVLTDRTSDPDYKNNDTDLRLVLTTPIASEELLAKNGFDFINYEDNTLSIQIDVYKNPDNLPIDAFMDKKYSGHGMTPTPIIQALKQNLKNSDIPKTGALVYEGSGGGETPRKTYYFINQNNFYQVSMFGGEGAGFQYGKDAEDFFDKLVATMTFK